MQILPTSESIQAARNAAYRNAKDNLDFSRLFNELSANTPAEITPLLDAVPEAYQARLAEAFSPREEESSPATPYTEHPTAQESTLVTVQAEQTPTQEIRLTPAEVEKLTTDLHKAGIDPQLIAQIQEVAKSPQGITVGKVVEILTKLPPAKLTDGDLVRIESLANKLDPTGALAKNLISSIRDGNIGQGWADFWSALQSAEGSLKIDRDEIVSLSKGLKINPETIEALSKSFGQNKTLELSADGLKSLLVPMQVSMSKFLEDQQKTLETLEKVLVPLIGEARQRLQKEASASLTQNKGVLLRQTLIEDTVTQNGFTRQGLDGQDMPTGKQQDVPTEQNLKPSKTSEQFIAAQTGQLENQKLQADNNKAQANRSDLSALAEKQAANLLQEKFAGKDGQKNSGDSQYSALHTAFNNIVNKKTETPANPWEAMLTRMNNVVVPATTNITTNPAMTPNSAQAALNNAALPAKVLSQMEAGMLTAMRDGSKQLELQLNPLELGVVSVLLTSRNGEVSATLRPERPETAALLSQQLEQLRANLEEQGLKVDKVDVQTGLKDGSMWAGTQNHNASQEQQAKAQELERQRRLNRVRQENTPEISINTQSLRQNNSQGIHLVA